MALLDKYTLLHIFEFLPLQTLLLKGSLVCSTWHKTLLHDYNAHYEHLWRQLYFSKFQYGPPLNLKKNNSNNNNNKVANAPPQNWLDSIKTQYSMHSFYRHSKEVAPQYEYKLPMSLNLFLSDSVQCMDMLTVNRDNYKLFCCTDYHKQEADAEQVSKNGHATDEYLVCGTRDQHSIVILKRSQLKPHEEEQKQLALHHKGNHKKQKFKADELPNPWKIQRVFSTHYGTITKIKCLGPVFASCHDKSNNNNNNNQQVPLVNKQENEEDLFAMSASKDGTIRLWNLTRLKCDLIISDTIVAKLSGTKIQDPIKDFVVLEQGKRFSFACAQGKHIIVWHVKRKLKQLVEKQQQQPTVAEEDLQYEYECEHKIMQEQHAHSQLVWCLTHSNGNSLSHGLLFSASADKTVKIWNWQTGKHIQTLQGFHTDLVSQVVAIPMQRRQHEQCIVLVTASFDKQIQLFAAIEQTSERDKSKTLANVQFHHLMKITTPSASPSASKSGQHQYPICQLLCTPDFPSDESDGNEQSNNKSSNLTLFSIDTCGWLFSMNHVNVFKQCVLPLVFDRVQLKQFPEDAKALMHILPFYQIRLYFHPQRAFRQLLSASQQEQQSIDNDSNNNDTRTSSVRIGAVQERQSLAYSLTYMDQRLVAVNYVEEEQVVLWRFNHSTLSSSAAKAQDILNKCVAKVNSASPLVHNNNRYESIDMDTISKPHMVIGKHATSLVVDGHQLISASVGEKFIRCHEFSL